VSFGLCPWPSAYYCLHRLIARGEICRYNPVLLPNNPARHQYVYFLDFRSYMGRRMRFWWQKAKTPSSNRSGPGLLWVLQTFLNILIELLLYKIGGRHLHNPKSKCKNGKRYRHFSAKKANFFYLKVPKMWQAQVVAFTASLRANGCTVLRPSFI
jgi:hypothetical protein